MAFLLYRLGIRDLYVVFYIVGLFLRVRLSVLLAC